MYSIKRAERGLRTWTQEALEAVQTKTMSDYNAAKQFGIPRRTIRRYITLNQTVKSKLGRKFVLSSVQDADLCSTIVRFAETGYPITTKMLRLCVYKYCVKNKIKHQFSDNKKIASYKWVRHFLKDNPTIVLRKSQNLNPARARKLNKFIVHDH